MSLDPIYLGSATIQQNDHRVEADAALYTEGHPPDVAFRGRYWGLTESVSLQEGEAVIRFHDATEAKVVLTHVGPDSGTFRLSGPLVSLRRY
jgi:hypothetical protein